MKYEKVCECWEVLDKANLNTRATLKNASQESISYLLQEAGCRFPIQKAKYLSEFGRNDIDLRVATRTQLVREIKGVGMKLASMFLNRTRGAEYAIIDIHVKRWLQEQGIWSDNGPYQLNETAFWLKAHGMGLTPTELDNKIWEERRLR